MRGNNYEKKERKGEYKQKMRAKRGLRHKEVRKEK